MEEGLITSDLERTLPVNVGFPVDPESLQENELVQLKGGATSLPVVKRGCPFYD